MAMPREMRTRPNERMCTEQDLAWTDHQQRKPPAQWQRSLAGNASTIKATHAIKMHINTNNNKVPRSRLSIEHLEAKQRAPKRVLTEEPRFHENFCARRERRPKLSCCDLRNLEPARHHPRTRGDSLRRFHRQVSFHPLLIAHLPTSLT